MSESQQSTVLLITCVDADFCSVVFEPYGTEHTLRREDSFRVVAEGGSEPIEISYSPGCITVWPGPSSEARVWNRAGEELPI